MSSPQITWDKPTQQVVWDKPAAALAPPKFTVGAPSSQPMETVLTPSEFSEQLRATQGNPGVSEGEGLREGLAEYDRESFGNLGRGAADLARGKIARGGHEIISGTTNALTPVTPLVIPAAPAAMARGIIGGSAGSYLARKGAEALGANPDQAALASDLGGITAGMASAEAPKILRAPIRATGNIATRIGQSADPDVVGIVSPRAANALRVARRVGSAANRIAGAEAPAALPPELTTEARTLPGQISPEVISPRIAPAAPIPPRSGLMLAAAPAETAAATPAAIPGAAGNLAESVAEPAPTLTNGARIKPAVAKDLGRMLNEATGAETPKPLRPGTPLRSQLAQQPGAAKLPEGFTPTPKSSFIQGFKYDPGAREFEYITNDGSHYVRGDVGPEAFAEFQKTAAEQGSFGKGVHVLKNHPEGGVGQFQVINGKRVPVVKTMPATDLAEQIKNSAEPPSATIPKTAPATDLAKQIKQSAKASAKTAAKTNAIPKTAPAAEGEDSLAAQLNEMSARVKKGESLKDLSKSR